MAHKAPVKKPQNKQCAHIVSLTIDLALLALTVFDTNTSRSTNVLPSLTEVQKSK